MTTKAKTPPAIIQNITVSPQVMQAQTAPSSVSGAASQTSVPGNGLLITSPLSSAAPLIEVDPRFDNQRQWLSSDYMLAQLSIDPATVQKRLGDGFYEQSLVRDQVAQLTGRRFLDGYSADEAQYRALIDNGVTVARALNLRPGVALSAAQAAQLTSDIVVLEATTVTLANGQTAQVLKPQVYLKPRAGDLQASTDKAVQDGKNGLTTGSLQTSDIQNKADYKAQAISVSLGTSAGQSSAGFGSDSGHASSTTTAGVSGIAGNKAVRTGDAQQGIGKIFDQTRVSQEVGAQVAITSAFGQQAAKAVGDYGQSKTKPVDDARERQALDKLAETGSLSAAQQTRLDTLSQQGMSSAQASANLADASLLKDYDNWKEGGAYRVAAHTAVGALAGGAGGALGSGTTAAAMPTVADAINDLKLPEPVRQAVIAATGTVIGATVGGTAGAVSGFNQTTNNYLTHDEASRRAKLMVQRLQCKDQSCATSTQAEIDKLNKLDTWRDQQIASACQSPSSALCSAWTGDIKAAAASYKGKFDSDPLINNERSSVVNDAFKYSQANNNPTLYGVGKGLLKLSPPGAVAGLAVGSYALVSAIVENGAVDTAIKLAQGIKDLPSDIKSRLNSPDPTVRGEALVDAIGLGAGAAALTTKLATTGYGMVVARAEANVVRQAETTAVANQLKEVAIHKDDSRFSQVAETIVEAKQAGWKTAEGRTWWPPENGKVPGTERTAELTVGQRLDRYGGTTDKSSFLAPSSTPIEQRALSPATDLSVHDQYVVVKPFAVEESRAMPWFDKPGMGIQYETTQGSGLPILELIKQGYLKKVSP